MLDNHCDVELSIGEQRDKKFLSNYPSLGYKDVKYHELHRMKPLKYDLVNDSTYCKTENGGSGHKISIDNIKCTSSNHFDIINMWYGVIDNIDRDIYQCRILDTSTRIEELIEFEIEEFQKDDYEMLFEGATFQFFIGYLTYDTGQKLRSSLIILDKPIPQQQEEQIKRTNKFISTLNRLKLESEQL